MGIEFSQEEYDSFAVEIYSTALQHPCLLPDIGIDEDLLKYSGTDSSALLQSYSNQLLSSVPGYIDRLGSAIGALKVIPNAVGLGALVISMILEIVIKSSSQASPNSYSLLRRVFGEEKGSAVRDTMSEYLKRHQMFMNNNPQLLEELRRLEATLSHQLTTLRNSLLYDGQMSSRNFKIWLNGASFHANMMIHEARLNVQEGKRASDYTRTIRVAINHYLRDLDNLLKKYKEFKTSTRIFSRHIACGFGVCGPVECYLHDDEQGCERFHDASDNYCWGQKMTDTYMNYLFSTYEPISGLKTHFSNMTNNLNQLINQRDSFTVPSAAP